MKVVREERLAVDISGHVFGWPLVVNVGFPKRTLEAAWRKVRGERGK